MAQKRYTYSKFEKTFRDQEASYNTLMQLEDDYYNSLSRRLTINEKIERQQKQLQLLQEKLNSRTTKYEAERQKALERQESIGANVGKKHAEAIFKIKQQIEEQKRLLAVEQNRKSNYEKISKILDYNLQQSKLWGFVMANDKPIRETIRHLGTAGDKSEQIRTNFENALPLISRMGGSLKDAMKIQTTYADMTGRAKILTSQMLKDVTAIGLGTNLGVGGAAEMAANFESMGQNIMQVKSFVQNVMDTSNQMGVNASKVLTSINQNFATLEAMTFNQGVQGFAKMAQYAQKFRIDMANTLSSANKMRGIESVIGSSATLQTLGGRFGSADPMQMLYLSRNNPEEYMKMINDMTVGIANFKKNSSGVFESYISPLDIDRLRQAGEALGLSNDELIKQARRMGEIQALRTKMRGLGLSDSDKKILEGIYQFDSKTGEFYAMVNNQAKSISQITSRDLQNMVKQTKTLEDMAINAQTFDEEWKAIGDMFKSTLLPAVRGLNAVMQFIKPVVDSLGKIIEKIVSTDIGKGILGAAGVGAAGFIGFRKVKNLIGGGSAASSMVGTAGAGASTGASTMGSVGGGISGNMTNAANILAVGAAIGAAAGGLSMLASAIGKLNPDQAKVLTEVTTSLTTMTAIGFAAAAAMVVFGQAGLSAAPGLFAVGGAIALIGVGIGAAGAGIGYMATKLNELVVNLKGSGSDMLQFANVLDKISNVEVSKNSGIAQLSNLFNKPLKVQFENGEVALKANVKVEMDSSLIKRIAIESAKMKVSVASGNSGGYGVK